jgi:hypothetical protein
LARAATLAIFSRQPARRIAAHLARHKTGFRLTVANDIRAKVIKQALHTRTGGSRGDQQCFCRELSHR